MYTFEKYQLRITDEEVSTETNGEHLIAATRMVQQCRRHISIISRELDPLIYGVKSF